METKDPIELLRECLKYEHALDLLREKLGVELKSGWHYACLDRLADEIEARYMRLPVDADGVPIRPGDRLVHNHKIVVAAFVADDYICTPHGIQASSKACRLVKPDAVAEELAKFLTACGDDDPHYYDEQIAEFAERIRKDVCANTFTNIKSDAVEGIIAEAMSFECDPAAPYSKSSKYVQMYAERIRKAVIADGLARAKLMAVHCEKAENGELAIPRDRKAVEQ